MLLRLLLAALLLSPTFCLPVGGAETPEEVDLFVAGEGGAHTYRIPAVIRTQKGSLLAFCEARRKGRSDTGDIDLVVRRSEDGGATWGKQQVVWDDAGNTCGNPCPVVDASTGRIWLPMTWNHGADGERQLTAGAGKDTRRVYITWSDDDGRTWARPKEITSSTKLPNWTWYATGPGVGIQLQAEPHKGRLVIPCDHKLMVDGQPVYRSHCFYSDDHGETWQLGAPVQERTNECAVAELSDGRLLLNMRSYHGKNQRAVATSDDGGASWGPVTFDQTLVEPVCQAALLRYDGGPGKGPGRLLFSNPASKSRQNMTVRLSEDDGKSWSAARVVEPASAAYSSLVPLPKGDFGLVYEADNYRKIRFIRLSLEGLEPGK